MEDDIKKSKAVINGDTQIVFTVKSFAGLIVTILTIFFGFYKLVIAPSIDEQKEDLKTTKTEMSKKFDNINSELVKINNGIGQINGALSGMNTRFDDLKRNHNSGGLGN